LILCGFNSKYICVWNETTGQEIASIDCGGSHKFFTTVHRPEDAGWFRLAFTRSSKMHIYSQSRTLHQVVQTGIHGREIRAVAWNGRVLATGSEDTTVRLWGNAPTAGLEDGDAETPLLRCLGTVRDHKAGIQSLKWAGDYLFSSAGNEEFFAWRVRPLPDGPGSVGIVCEGVFDQKTADGDLRITDFDAAVEEQGTENQAISIAMAFSNSTLKIYTYHAAEDKKFLLKASGRYTGACLTQIRWLAHDSQVLTAATDGHIALWTREGEPSESLVPTLVVALHQNSIKCLHLQPFGKEEPISNYIVVTGGDDNALGAIHVSKDPAGNGLYKVVSQRVVTDAHAASINGVTRWNLGHLGHANGQLEFFVTSASNDQRIKTWRISMAGGGHGLSVALLQDLYSGVADVGDIEVLASDNAKERLIVAGVGMEIWEAT